MTQDGVGFLGRSLAPTVDCAFLRERIARKSVRWVGGGEAGCDTSSPDDAGVNPVCDFGHNVWYTARIEFWWVGDGLCYHRAGSRSGV